MDVQRTPFVRELASSDRKIRDKAVDSLSQFLKARRDLELVELLKIWKGLFFCFYHSDRPLTQQSLARALSYTLLPSLPEPLLQPFLRAFWITMSRDFHALDRLRLDKYLYLLRCYVGAAFEILVKRGLKAVEKKKVETEKEEKEKEVSSSQKGKKHKGKKGKKQTEAETETETEDSSKKRKREVDDEGAEDSAWRDLETYVSMLEEGPLCPYNFVANEPKERSETKMAKGPDGIRYHLMDIWLDELEKVAAEPVEEKTQGSNEDEDDETTKTTLKPGVPMELLLRPFETMHAKNPNKVARKRAAGLLGDERLVDWGVREPKKPEEKEDSDEEWGGFD